METPQSLEADYAQAFEEWCGSQDEALWDTVVGDGLDILNH